MKTKYVFTNTPTSLPILGTATCSFALWFFKADPIWIGVFSGAMGIIWLLTFISKWNEKGVDLFEFLEQLEKTRDTNPINRSSFADRIEEAMKAVQTAKDN